MTRDQLQAARHLLNLSELSRAIGQTRSYLRTYLNAGRELPADVQRRIAEVLAGRGLCPAESEAPREG